MNCQSVVSIVLFMLLATACSDDVQQTGKENMLRSGEINPYIIFSFEKIEDSIRLYERKIDNALEKNMARLKLAPASDSVAAELFIFLSEYKASYKANLRKQGRAMYLAAGAHKANHRKQCKIEYFAVIIEYQKTKAILSEICGNYFESGLIQSDSIDGVPACLYDF